MNTKKPINFTFNSQGKVIYKKRVDAGRLPKQQVEALQITNVSKIKNLSAIQRKREYDEAAKAAKLALELELQ